MCPEPEPPQSDQPRGSPAGPDASRNWSQQRDGIDEWRATQIRNRLGARGWLLSWSRESRRWVARLSRPEFPRTIVRTGRDRIDAIDRAMRASSRIIQARLEIVHKNRIAEFLDDPGEAD